MLISTANCCEMGDLQGNRAANSKHLEAHLRAHLRKEVVLIV
jgi:hypothetical protein